MPWASVSVTPAGELSAQEDVGRDVPCLGRHAGGRVHRRRREAHLEGLPAAPDLRSALDVALGVLSCLQVVHERGLVHLDLAPENVFLEPDGGVRLVDFGLTQRERGVVCHPADSALTTLGAMLGTPEVASPERLRGRAARRAARTSTPSARSSSSCSRCALRSRAIPRTSRRGTSAGSPRGRARSPRSLRPSRPSSSPASPRSARSARPTPRACGPRSRRRAPRRSPWPAAPPAPRRPRETTRPRAPRTGTTRWCSPWRPAAPRPRSAPSWPATTGTSRGSAATASSRSSPARKRRPRSARLLAGREIVASVGAPLAIHIAPLKLRRDAESVHAAGIAVERPESWLLADSWRGIALSAELVTAHPGFDVVAASEDGRYFFAPDAPPPSGHRDAARAAPPLVGRGDAQGAVEESRERALARPRARPLRADRRARRRQVAARRGDRREQPPRAPGRARDLAARRARARRTPRGRLRPDRGRLARRGARREGRRPRGARRPARVLRRAARRAARRRGVARRGRHPGLA